MHYCLNKDELRQLIDHIVRGAEVDDEQLQARIENAQNWHDELAALTYLFSQVLERKLAAGEGCETLIEALYTIPERMFFFVQECDQDFVEYMLQNVRRESLSLEEELVDLQHKLSSHLYDRTLRY